MKAEFRSKRRQEIVNKRPEKYRKLVLHYKKQIENKLEQNLQLIAKHLRLELYQIEDAQERHLSGLDLTFILGVEEFLSSSVPAWLSGEKALQIY